MADKATQQALVDAMNRTVARSAGHVSPLDRIAALEAENARLTETLARVRSYTYNAPHDEDCVAHLYNYEGPCSCGLGRWQDGHNSAIGAVRVILDGGSIG